MTSSNRNNINDNNDQIDPYFKQRLSDLPGAYYFEEELLDWDNEKQKSVFEECFSYRGSSRGGISRTRGPRVTAFGGLKYKGSEVEYPRFLEDLIKILLNKGVILEKPFQISINSYDNPQKGMIAHKDGVGSRAAIITLGSHTVLEFYKKEKQDDIVFTEVYSMSDDEVKKSDCKVLMRPGSVLLMTGPSFTEFAHGITPKEEDVVSDDLINLSLCKNVSLNQNLKRSSRVSIVMWTL